jgi:uncharacterized protein YjbJ (UPF0337 family)
MDDIHSGARAPAEAPPAPQAVSEATGAAAEAAGNVAGTAKEQARQVTGEVSAQARSVAADVRDRVADEARTQNDRLTEGIRRMADELDSMAAERGDSPARAVVSRVAQGGRQVADYLAERGPEGVLSEVQDFARRRPGAFLATALATGFVVGRLGKGVFGAAHESEAKPRTDAFVSDIPPVSPEPSYPTSAVEPGPTTATPATSTTSYASTGTGTPRPLGDEAAAVATAPLTSAPLTGPRDAWDEDETR